MKQLIAAALFIIPLSVFAQLNTTKRRFADTEPQILRYRVLCQKAYEKNDSKLAYTYYDSITNCITHSYVDNHKFETIDNKIYQVGKLGKPIFLMTSASWCTPCMAEIPALNRLVDEYSNRIDFVVLFWDTKKRVIKLARKYNHKIYLVASKKNSVDEAHTIDIAGFRNINGYPSAFLIDGSRQIVSFKTGATVPGSYTDKNGKEAEMTVSEAYNINYKRLKNELAVLIK